MALPSSLLHQLLTPIMRPAARMIVGFIAIPLLRALRSRIQPAKDWDEELEKDLEQWFRASLVLFLATKNVEAVISEWMMIEYDVDLDRWYIAAGRLLLAIGVIETMPDQQLFSIIHPGPSRLKWFKDCGLKGNIRQQFSPCMKGLACLHLSRSSPVFAILAVIIGGTEGWIFYFLAILQYLIIGLVTSRDKALDALVEFDRQVARRRQELVEEFQVDEKKQQDEAKPSAERLEKEPIADNAMPVGRSAHER